MKLVIPKSIPNVHLLQSDSKGPGATPPLSGAYPIFYDGAKSGKRPHSSKRLETRTIPYGDLLSTALQLAYKQIQDMMELLPKMNNVEKKQQIINGCLRIREQMYKLAIMTDFLGARGTDLALAEMGMDALRGYGAALVTTADSMVVSLTQTLVQMLPKPALPQAIRLITTGGSTNLPLIMKEFCTMNKTGGSEQWLRRLDNVIKLHVSKLQFGNSRLERINDGVALLSFVSASVKLTLVPIFETNSYAWHILDVDPGDLITSVSSRTALLIQFQSRFNRRPTQDLLDLPIQLEKDLSRLALLSKFNRLQADFVGLRETMYPNLEIQMTSATSFKVVPWKHLGKASPSLTVTANVALCTLSVESSMDSTLSIGSAEEMFEILVTMYAGEKLKHLHDRLQEAAPISLPLFDSSQLVLDQVLHIDMPCGEIEISMQKFSGALIVKDCVEMTKLLASNRIDQIVKYLKARRTKELLRLLSTKNNVDSPIYVCDPATVSVPQLSSNYLVFALKNFVGKTIAVDLGHGPLKTFLVSEDASMSGRLVVDQLPDLEVLNLGLQSPGEIYDAVSSKVESYISVIIQQELSMRGILSKQNNALSWTLLNIGVLPSVKQITLHASVSSLEIRLDFGRIIPINPEFTQTSAWYSEPHCITSSGRVDVNSVFRRLYGFLSLLAISKQLELRQVKHELSADSHLHFGHAQIGRIRISVNDKDYDDRLPLVMSFDRPELLHPDQVDALQRQIRQSLSIGPIVEYLNRLLIP